jgi:hypothetical protein
MIVAAVGRWYVFTIQLHEAIVSRFTGGGKLHAIPTELVDAQNLHI